LFFRFRRDVWRFDFSVFEGFEKETFFSERVKKTQYPFRLLRYWRAVGVILEEARTFSEMVIVDFGCERGLLKRFMPPLEGAKWIGLDKNPHKEALILEGYHAMWQCDFDQPIPLADHSADIIVCLHVFEHLPRPEFTLKEMDRILRPGGLLIAETPVLPEWLAKMRRRQLAYQLKKGRRQTGDHINAFSIRHWRDTVKQTGFKITFQVGSHLWRWSGSPLENRRLWVRLNQLWGALFPSLGRNLFLELRKGSKKKTDETK
jgi:SAM-dependent methyltransferase